MLTSNPAKPCPCCDFSDVRHDDSVRWWQGDPQVCQGLLRGAEGVQGGSELEGLCGLCCQAAEHVIPFN